MSGAAAPRDCPACGTPPRGRYRLRNGARLKQCPRCLLGWWNWPPLDPTAFYDQDYFQSETSSKGYNDYASLEAGVRRTARGRLRRLERLLREAIRAPSASARGLDHSTPSDAATSDSSEAAAAGSPRARAWGSERKRLLEIGCGTGCFLDEARRAGWECEGVEVSEYAAERARLRGLNVLCRPIEELALPNEAFDAVVLWDVIEHVRDPAGVIGLAGAALRGGGILALSTGDLTSLCARFCGPSWHLFNLPEHLFFFSPRSLELLLTQAGCRVRQITREVNWVPASYVAERLAKPLGLRPPSRLIGANWIVPATLFDVVGVYATRALQDNQGPIHRAI